MKKIIKTKLEKLASVLNDLEIDVSVVLFAYREESSAETSNYDKSELLKKPHILKWTVKVVNYEIAHDTKFHKDTFYYCLTASIDDELYIEYDIECDELKQCSINFFDGKDETYYLALNLINTEDMYTRESLSKKLDDYIQMYSK